LTVHDGGGRTTTSTDGEHSVSEPASITIDGVGYYSAADVARELGVSRQSLWKWRLHGKIPQGRRYRNRLVVFTTTEFFAIRDYSQRLEPARLGASKQKRPGGQSAFRNNRPQGGSDA
jgi:hypothetical protein